VRLSRVACNSISIEALRGFLVSVKRSYIHKSSPGQTEGLKGGKTKGLIKTKSLGRIGGFKEWVDRWV
jgi:hypothetical protein